MPKHLYINALTGEVVEKEMEGAELEEYEARLAYTLELAEKEATEAAKAEAKRQALLDKLGIDADEAKLLLG
jgi:hypothetical protein